MHHAVPHLGNHPFHGTFLPQINNPVPRASRQASLDFLEAARRLSAVLTPDITTSKDGKAGWIFLGRVSDFCYS